MSRFYKNYNMWIEECERELRDKSINPEDVEILENGQIHYLSSCVMTRKAFVTPWEESEFYVPLDI